MDKANKKIIDQLLERASRLYWTYVIQYNQAEVYHRKLNKLTLISLICSGLIASAAFINVIISFGISENIGNVIIFFLGLTSTIILSYISKFDYTKRIESHIHSGTAVRRLWMKYQSLITDIKSGRFQNYEAICVQRDLLRDEEYNILKDAPITLQTAYRKAEKKIHKDKHGEITKEEKVMCNESQNID